MSEQNSRNPDKSAAAIPDAVALGWRRFRLANRHVSSVQLSQTFSPTIALAFAQDLAKANSEDEAIRIMDQNREGVEAFCVAAHFCYSYLPPTTDSTNDSQKCSDVPYIALARAVARFLTRLPPEFLRTTEPCD